MALTSISVVVNNNPYTCCIDITSTAEINTLGDISVVEIYRNKYGVTGIGNKIMQKNISSVSDLNFNFTDMSNKSGVKYVYTVRTKNSSSQVIQYSQYTVDSWFDGLFIGDFDNQYVAPLNCNTTYTQKTQSNYITTLSARTPYKVTNSNLNYAEGNSSAMFLSLDNNNNPVPDYSGEYTNEVITFLSDGKDKILKTSRGEIWLVNINQDISVDPNDNYEGTRIISFDWTEIGDVPILRTV